MWLHDVKEVYGDEDVAHWALQALQEYQYRKIFGLSKKEMLQEPVKDFITNSRIHSLIKKAEERESKRAKSNVAKKGK